MKAYKASNVEVVSRTISLWLRLIVEIYLFKSQNKVLYSYAIGSLYVFVGELLFDNIGDAVAFWSEVSLKPTTRVCRIDLELKSLFSLACLLACFFVCASRQHPVETYGYTFIFSITGYMGINIVLQLVKHFGALLAVTGNRNSTIDF